jgi:betaine-aldehyde dehydrogenase
LQKVYEAFESEKEAMGNLITKSMGMPISFRNDLDINSGFHYFKGYLDNAQNYLSPEISFEDDTTINTVYYEPTGVVAAITPWNFPFCNFIWSVIPNLIVGNTVIFKHAPECASFGQLLEKIITKTNLPKGVFAQIYGDGTIGDILVHQDIDLICFTGSSKVGKYLYNVAAEKFIKIILELGGSAPAIVFEDADMSKLSDGVFFNRFANSGQICDGLKRLIVHKSIEEKVINNLVEMLKSKKVGDPGIMKETGCFNC